jgi:hypothetical protein
LIMQITNRDVKCLRYKETSNNIHYDAIYSILLLAI